MLIVKCLVTAICCCFSCFIFSQPIKPIPIGGPVPGNCFTIISGQGEGPACSNDYRDKLLILDFWASWCTSCIKAFPKLDSIQAGFGDSIQILLVNEGETINKIEAFRQKQQAKVGKPFSLAIVAGDTIFRSLFPHQSIPHYAWIYKGNLVAVTGPSEIRSSTIRSILKGETFAIKMKRDVMDYDPTKPILENDNGGSSGQLLYRGLFSKELEGMINGTWTNKDSQYQRYTYINLPVLTLYKLALGFDFNCVLLDSINPSFYIGENQAKYCYEITAPTEVDKKKLTSWMVQDLNRYLGLKGRMENREMKCYVLKSGKQSIHASLTGLGKPRAFYKADLHKWRFEKQTLGELVHILNSQDYQWPPAPIFLNGSVDRESFTLELPADAFRNIQLLRKELIILVFLNQLSRLKKQIMITAFL